MLQAREELIEYELLDVDADEVMIRRWLKNCPPGNRKHAQGIARAMEAIDSEKLRKRAEGEFEPFLPLLEGDPLAHIPSSPRNSLASTAYMNSGRR